MRGRRADGVAARAGLAMTPKVSVIIPHLDQPAALSACLESLARQSAPQSLFEVIVGDNGSGDEHALQTALMAFPGARLAREERRGAAHARNAAMALARGEILAFTDADCVADREWIAAGLAALSDYDLCGGEIVVTSRDEERPSSVEAFERVFAFRQRLYVARRKFSATANLFVRKAAAEAVGPFVNGVSEDVDWCRRAGTLGFRLAFNARSIIRHPARRDWPSLVAKWERLTRERWNGVEGRSPASRLKWAGLAVATALSAAPHLVRVLTTRRLRRFKDRVAAALVLARIRFWRARRMLALLRPAGVPR